MAHIILTDWWAAQRAHRLSIGFISLMLFTCNTAFGATNAHVLTLQRAIERTLQQHPRLQVFDSKLQALRGQRETADQAPPLALGVDVENVLGTGDAEGINNAELTVAISSVLELGSKRQSRVAVVDATLDTVELERQAQTLDVLGELTSSFIQLLSTQQTLHVATEAVVLSEALFTTVQKRSSSGAASDAEVMRAKAMLTQSKIQKDELLRRLEREKMSLARYWGSTKPDFLSVAGDLFAFGERRDFSELYQQVQQSPAMMVFASESRLKDAELSLVQTQQRADLGWQFGITRNEISDDFGLALAVSMPLFAERRQRGANNTAMAERNAVELRRSDRLLALHDHLYSAYSQREQFIAVHQQLRRSVIPDLEKALSISREAYDRGRLRYQDWIAAQQELLHAKQRLIETATAALLNQAVIERLTAESLTN